MTTDVQDGPHGGLYVMAVDPSKLKIVNYPDPVLRKVAGKVARFDDELRAVAARMIELMRAAPGVGLAAPQVGLSWRVFVVQPGEKAPARVMCNPVLTLSEESDIMEEGCLSLPEVRVDVRRPVRCTIHAQDEHGQPVTFSATDLEARVWQHETDHLNGRLIIDVMSEAEKIANRRLLRNLERDFKKG